jgi:hypothetical protein
MRHKRSTVSRVLDEMARQHISYVQLAARLRQCFPGSGWSENYMALRLGELMPVTPNRTGFGGRVPLTVTETEQMAAALGVRPAVLLFDPKPRELVPA